MYECWNCGEPPDSCVCVPWCWKHNRIDLPPCHLCAIERALEEERRQMLAPFIEPWGKRLRTWLT